MTRLKIITATFLAANITSAIGASTHVTCVVDDYADGNPKSFKVVFDDTDKSWIDVNDASMPYEESFGSAIIQSFDDTKIEWCLVFSRGKGNDPGQVCHVVNRMTGSFTITHHRTGKTKTGRCTPGASPEGRKF